MFKAAHLAPGTGPYAERLDVPESALDRLLLSGLGRLEAFISHKGGDLARAPKLVYGQAVGLEDLTAEALKTDALSVRAALIRNGFATAEKARAFALVREAARRVLGMAHYDVQIMGGWAMLGGALAEMQTGEGKTLTALLPAATAALAGLPVHVITANDYLAARDAELMRPVYEALGLTVGLVTPEPDADAHRAAYACDITYCTSKDAAFDFLRDRTALGARRARARLTLDAVAGQDCASRRLILRGLGFALIDEADSVLIDDARTPLILSASEPASEMAALYAFMIETAKDMKEGTAFEIDRSARRITLLPQGEHHLAEQAAAHRDLPLIHLRRARDELGVQALNALHLYDKDRHYILADDKVQIVDDNTGRIMADRSWEGGLHQLIEAKEGCETTSRRVTIARITYQRFFRRYALLSGMTGTARESIGEFKSVYGLKVVAIPTHKPSLKINRGFQLVVDADAKWQAVAKACRAAVDEERPVLIGTRSVHASEALGQVLDANGLPHRILNARQDREEAEIVAGAGVAGRITVATNMAGRGTDIHLEQEAKKAGGLHVILTEFHDSARIDRQLFGRCGRQGDPGIFEAIVALSDEIFETLPPWLRKRLERKTARNGSIKTGIPWLRLYMQAKTERRDARTRRQTLTRDRQLDKALGFSGVGE